LCVPICISALICSEAAVSRPWSRVVRQWASLSLILIGYWLQAWVAGTPPGNIHPAWEAWDKHLLDGYGLNHVVEAFGWAGPALLETCYLLVYAIPPLSLGLVYACGERRRANQYLAILFLGTLSAYALLPLFPTVSPRLAFPTDVPPFRGIARAINIALLDRFDISTGVFPSGHVAVAFSSALGLFTVMRKRFWVRGAAFAMTILVYIATIYGRYHYAIDGLASLGLVLATWVMSGAGTGLIAGRAPALVSKCGEMQSFSAAGSSYRHGNAWFRALWK